MRIGFWLTTPKEFDPANIDNEIFGGTEIAAICLAKELIKKNSVDVIGNCDKGRFGDIRCLNYKDFNYFNNLLLFDVLIVVRAGKILHSVSLPNRPKVVILWTGDESSQPVNQALWNEDVVNNIDLLVVKSNWQAKNLLTNFHFLDGNKMEVMRKGFDDSFVGKFKPVKKPKFICASTIFRGIHNFVEIWPKIKKEIPEAELDIFASTKLYNHESRGDIKYRKMFDDLRLLEDVTLKDPIPHNEFLKRLPDYYVMLYPNLGFNETSCGVALEAMAYGVPVISSHKAGLKEILCLSESGFGISPDVNYEKYINLFVEKTVWLWKNQELRDELAREAKKELMENYSWKTISQKWFQLLEIQLKKKKDSQKSSLVSLDDIPRTQDLRSTIITH